MIENDLCNGFQYPFLRVLDLSESRRSQAANSQQFTSSQRDFLPAFFAFAQRVLAASEIRFLAAAESFRSGALSPQMFTPAVSDVEWKLKSLNSNSRLGHHVP